MKNLATKFNVAVLAVLAATFLGSALLAEAAASAPVMPDWVTQIVTYLETIPKVGSVITFVFQLVAILASIFTMATVFLTGACKSLSVLTQLANLAPTAEKIQAFHDKVWPYLAYLSIFNVQKKKD